jgi:phosphoribosylformylglycinamidine synthase
MIGILPDVNKRCTQEFKNDGDVIILLGETKEELGGSEYLKVVHGQVRGQAPELDLDREKALQKVVYQAIQQGLLNSAHDCSEGGLAVALAECCISNRDKTIGANINSSFVIRNSSLRADAHLFGESQSRVIVSCSSENGLKIATLAQAHNVPCQTIGEVGGRALVIDKLIGLELNKLAESWRGAIAKALDTA